MILAIFMPMTFVGICLLAWGMTIQGFVTWMLERRGLHSQAETHAAYEIGWIYKAVGLVLFCVGLFFIYPTPQQCPICHHIETYGSHVRPVRGGGRY